MRCRVCLGEVVIELPRHNAAFCPDHFTKFCRDQVAKAIKEFDMINEGDRCLVAVSGGKDSIAIWDILLELGYAADGFYVGLGIDDYSDVSGQYARKFAAERGIKLIEVDLREQYDYDIPQAAAKSNRVPCSSCGLSKRHLFDKAALDGGYDVLVTGHNLDDEAAVLYGNVLRWQVEYLARQKPVLEAGNGLPKKVKPLVRLTERETAAYCIIKGLDYQVEECPMAAGNKHLQFKEALNRAEEASAGIKNAFYFGFLRNALEPFERAVADGYSSSGIETPVVLGACIRCGSTSSAEVCAFCRLVENTAGAKPT